jgi:glycosyltransferase involved in cell wall biosynthesis
MKALVVCPTYGRIPYLGRMLASFLSQDYDDKHLVIINDDKNIELCCDYKNVTIININQRLTVGQKRNIGVSIGEYDLILPFDDDDVFLPKRISNNVLKISKGFHGYRNIPSYITYDKKFSIGDSPPNCFSFLKTKWFDFKGYQSLIDGSDDTRIYDQFVSNGKTLVEKNANDIDFVYNFSGVNYHLSAGAPPKHIENVAYHQLKVLGIVGKKYYIEPDFDKLKMITDLVDLYTINKTNINIKFGKDAEIYVDV